MLGGTLYLHSCAVDMPSYTLFVHLRTDSYTSGRNRAVPSIFQIGQHEPISLTQQLGSGPAARVGAGLARFPLPRSISGVSFRVFRCVFSSLVAFVLMLLIITALASLNEKVHGADGR